MMMMMMTVFRGPNKKVRDHQADCQCKKEGRKYGFLDA